MLVKTCFRLECPDCGRALRINVDLLGKNVACDHCGGRFVAYDPSTLANANSSAVDQQLLLVQPDRDQLSMLARRFTELQFRVTPVHHPRQALEAATFKEFHVAVVDGSLPEIDCLGLCHHLNRHIHDLRIVATVESDHELLKGLNAENIWCVVEKPFAIPSLEAIVQEAMRTHPYTLHQALEAIDIPLTLSER